MTIIIKSAGKKVFLPFEVTCGRCETVMEITESKDIEAERINQPGEIGDGFVILSITCPVCKHKVNIPNEKREMVLKTKNI